MRKLFLNCILLLCALIVGSGSLWGQVTIWSENFSAYSADNVPSGNISLPRTGTSLDASGTLNYACTNGTKTSGSTAGGTTAVKNEELAGGAKPEIMVGKKGSGTGAVGGSFTATIPLDNIEGTLTLTYYQNNKKLKVSSTSQGVSGGQEVKPDAAGQQTTTFTGITSSMTSITIKFEATTSDNVRLDNIILTGYKSSGVAIPTFSLEEGNYSNAKSVELACSTDGATIYYTLDGTTPTSSSSVYSTAISVSETQTINAIAKKGDAYSSVASATYTILPIIHAGTVGDPYSVNDARNAIDAIDATKENVYVAGIVCTGGSSLSSGKMNYWISDDGTETDKLEAYKGKNLGNTNFSATTDVKIGDVVTIYGSLTKYNSTYEFSEGNYLTIHKKKPSSPTFSPAAGTYTSAQSVELACSTAGVTIYYTLDDSDPSSSSIEYTSAINVSADITIKAVAIKEGVSSNIAIANYTINTAPYIEVSSNSVETTNEETNGTLIVTYGNLTDVLADVIFYEPNGTDVATYDHSWVVTGFDGNNLEYIIAENTINAARSAYFKIYAVGNEGEVYSELITISQAAAPYASLPFEYDGNGTGNVPIGLIPSGLGTYASSPKMQFNGSNDCLILKFNEAPGELKYDIKGNSFSGGTFEVQYSIDGSSFTTFKQYTKLGDTQTETFISYTNYPITTRYIKWLYTNKSSGNVGIGNIILQGAASVSTLEGRNYGTMVTPADKKLAFNAATGVTAYVATGLGGEYVSLSPVDVVPEGTPIIIKTDVKGATISVPVTSANASSTTGSLLVAGDGATVANSDYYYLAQDEFHLAISGTLQEGKAYLNASALGNAPSLLRIVEGENNATNIESIEANEKAVKFIENGRILIMKNGIVYDALGRIVK